MEGLRSEGLGIVLGASGKGLKASVLFMVLVENVSIVWVYSVLAT